MDMTIDHVLTRGVFDVLPKKEGLASLMGKKKIRLYQGFDPSAPSLHLGNYVGLMKLRQFQKLGHEVIFLVGDFTGMIGDPTDKMAMRKKLTREQVLENCKAWKEQASRVIDFTGENAAKILFNSTWSDKLTFKDIIEITSNFTVQQMIERDMFDKRLKEQKPIYLHEFLYPVAQAIDSVEMDVDLEIGGSDQIFNMMAGRTLMKAMKGKEKYVLATKLLVDKDGSKVGKTTGNALFLDSTPNDFYSGIMSFPDDVIVLGFELLTEVELSGIEEQVQSNPMQEKKCLAYETVKILWGEDKAKAAEENFIHTFQKREQPLAATPLALVGDNTLVTVLETTGLSKSEIRRLIDQHAIDVDGNAVTDLKIILQTGAHIRVGKKAFYRIG